MFCMFAHNKPTIYKYICSCNPDNRNVYSLGVAHITRKTEMNAIYERNALSHTVYRC